MAIDTKEAYIAFKNNLYKLAKVETEENKIKHQKIVGGKREIVGLSMADMRNQAKQIVKGTPFSFLELAKDETYEETMIWGIVAATLSDFETSMKYLDLWKDKIDCWSLCDSVCCSIKNIPSALEDDAFLWAKSMCFDEREFVSRFGIVLMLTCFLKEKYIDNILEICRMVKNKAFYVEMALAWLVCEIVVRFREKGFGLIKAKALSKFVQNKAISKCHDSFRLSAEEKQQLKKFKIN